MDSNSKESVNVVHNSEKNVLCFAIIVIVTMFAFYFGWKRGGELAETNRISISKLK